MLSFCTQVVISKWLKSQHARERRAKGIGHLGSPNLLLLTLSVLDYRTGQHGAGGWETKNTRAESVHGTACGVLGRPTVDRARNFKSQATSLAKEVIRLKLIEITCNFATPCNFQRNRLLEIGCSKPAICMSAARHLNQRERCVTLIKKR